MVENLKQNKTDGYPSENQQKSEVPEGKPSGTEQKSERAVAAAVHTRDCKINIGMDYGWHGYVPKRDSLSNYEFAEVHREVLRDTSGDTRKFALFITKQRAGLLICDMLCERYDELPRPIRDTLYAEFNSTQKTDLLEFGAWLLTCSDAEYQKAEEKAVAYAEQIYLNRDNPEKLKDTSYSFSHSRTAVSPIKFSGKYALPYKGDRKFPDDPNVRMCAAYMKYLATSYRYSNKESFVFVSTGRVGLERCKKVADWYDTCLILTMTSDIATETVLDDKNFLIRVLNRFDDIVKTHKPSRSGGSRSSQQAQNKEKSKK